MNAPDIIGLLVSLIFAATVGLAAWYLGRISASVQITAKNFRDACTAVVIDFSDAIARLELLVKEMQEESGRVGTVYGTAPVPPNMPRLSDDVKFLAQLAQLAPEDPGYASTTELREALHSNKIVMPPIIEECFLCACTITGWSGPHCHYHHASIPEGRTDCLYAGQWHDR